MAKLGSYSCEFCAAPFTRKNPGKNIVPKFCSRSCVSASRYVKGKLRVGFAFTCRCGAEVVATASIVSGGKKLCRPCIRARKRKYNERSVDYVREWIAAKPGKRTEYLKRWREKFPEKARAHGQFRRALRHGVISRKPCEVCGDQKVHGHHEDYSRPLDVIWLCVRCHGQTRRKENPLEFTGAPC